jgi:hypothetical protein
VDDKKFVKKFAKFTPHDLRRTAATMAQSLRVPRDYVKALLNHKDGDVTAIYARHVRREARGGAGYRVSALAADAGAGGFGGLIFGVSRGIDRDFKLPRFWIASQRRSARQRHAAYRPNLKLPAALPAPFLEIH